MKNKQSNLVISTKILASTLLVGVGAVGIYADSYPDSVRTKVGAAILTLGLWLSVGAWTGRSVTSWLVAMYLWNTDLGTNSTKHTIDRSQELGSEDKTSAA